MRLRPKGFGFSAFGFSTNWEFTKTDQDVAQDVMDFLADRRVLTIQHFRHTLEAPACLASAAECRAWLSEKLPQVSSPQSDLRVWLRNMRKAFTEFIEAGGPDGERFGRGREDTFNEALALLRDRVQLQANEVSDRYKLRGLDLPEDE